MIKIENYKNHSIMKRGDECIIFWFRGKEEFNYNVTEELAEKSRKSYKEALEVVFYLEHWSLPKEGGVGNYS